MTINRSALRKSSTADLLKKVQDAAKNKGNYGEKDGRMWTLSKDANGNGAATIRFLPAKTEEGLPFVKFYSYGFKGPTGKWFIEDSPSTIGLPDPVMEANSELWNSGFEDDKETARKRKRRLSYYSNIMVLKDPANPENEGKVFLYRYGQKLFDKLMLVMNPPPEYGDEPRDPFAFFDGCVMKLRMKQKAGFANFDDTLVEPAKDLFEGDEEKLSEVLDQLHNLEEVFHDPKRFKPYAELKAKFLQVIGESSPRKVEADDEEDGVVETGTVYRSNRQEDEELKPQTKKVVEEDEEEDDDLAFFKKLAAE